MIHVLDLAEVRAESLEEFLRILVDEHLPAARSRGLGVAGVWRTPAEAGPPTVTVLWAVDDWAAWARARSLASRDPEVAGCARRLRALCVTASRRFLIPVEDASAAR